jgi:hypothetical protein
MRLFLLVLLVGCSSAPKRKVLYQVSTHTSVYLCREYHHSAYGASAKNCIDLATSEHIDLIANPYNIKILEQNE